MSQNRIDVGVLGATGMVGQQFIARLAGHPWFNVRWLAASERSEGKAYAEAAPWRLASPMPDAAAARASTPASPGRGPKVVFSALDAKAADELEHQFAAAGHVVLSNARSHRMDPLVPLLIPEINADHLCLLAEQRRAKGWSGAIVTNPNCAAVVLAMALAPLRQFGLRRVVVTTMQAVSGAGYPGVPSLDILGNIIPFIGGGEEEKIETETLKILGGDGGRAPHPAVISAQVKRVPVIDGHTIDGVGRARGGPGGRRGRRRPCGRSAASPQELDLPTAPDPPLLRPIRRQPAAAAARCRSRRRHDGLGRPRARVSGAHAQVRRARAQHDSRRGRRVDPQCRADESGGDCCEKA